jgi:CRP/FNR family transcriptional regulator, cyclic AMP receptor protein
VTYEPGSLLDRLADDDLGALLALGTPTRFAKDAPLFLEGEHADHVLAVGSGRVKICFADRGGREVVLAVRGPGDLLGDLSAIDGEPRSAAGYALEPVEAIVITADAFRSLLTGRPRLALALIEELAGRLRDADRKRIEFGAVATEARVARRLVELARRFGEQPRPGGGVRIALRLSQDELAGFTGRSREAVAKALAGFRARGWVETGRRTVVVVDLEALARRAR